MRITYLLRTFIIAAVMMMDAAYAQQLIFAPIDEVVGLTAGNKPLAAKQQKSAVQTSTKRFSRKLTNTNLSDDEYILDMPAKAVRMKRMKTVSRALSSQKALSDELEAFSFVDSYGSLVFTKRGGKLVSARIHDTSAKEIYIGNIDKDGHIEFVQQDIHNLLCVAYPKENHTVPYKSGEPRIAAIDADDDPESLTEAQVRSLESRPSSQKVLFIDYWGGTLSNTAWNADYTNNQPIVYEPYDTEGDSSTFSSSELHRMYSAWAETAEDYAPFDINVTTDIAVFNTTPVNRRVRIIATPTDAWFVNVEGFSAGGVAYVDVFGLNSSFYTVGWSWNDSFSSMGMTHAHEAGHQMGLSHDGQLSPAREYYSGQGNWGPIMGGPFGLDYVQWSNGQYGNANQFEDDLTIIENALGLVADDVPNTTLLATPIDVGGADFIGEITPQGISADTDVMVIQQGVTSTVTLLVRPLFEGNNPTGTGVNLSMRARFFDDSDNTIAEIAPTGDPSTNVLSYSASLSPGTYYISVTNESYNTNLTTGFNEYGNGGFYQLSVSGGFSDPNPDLLVVDAEITPSSIEPAEEGDVTLTTQIRNIGFNAATQYSVTYYQSADQTISTSDTVLNSDTINTELGNSETSAVFQYAFQPPQEAGNYYYGVCVSAVAPTESNTNNNCSSAVSLTVDDGFCFPVKAANGNVALVCL